MGFLSHLFYPWSLLLQIGAVIHFIRRRPNIYWLYIIIFLSWVGALVYIFVEVLPDLGLARESFKVFPRRKRINQRTCSVPGCFRSAVKSNIPTSTWCMMRSGRRASIIEGDRVVQKWPGCGSC